MFIIRSTFPQLDKCQKSIKQIVITQNQIVGSLNASATPAFNTYAEKQPKEMAEGLKTIRDAYKTQSEHTAIAYEAIQTFPTDIELLRFHHNGIMNLRKESGPLYERHELAKYNLKVANMELEKLQKNEANEAQINEAKRKVEIAEKEEKEYSNYDQNYEKQFLDYEKKFGETLSKPMEKVARKWAESSRLIAGLAETYEKSTQGFQNDPTDNTIDKLKEVLEKIDEQLAHIDASTIKSNENYHEAATKMLVQENINGIISA